MLQIGRSLVRFQLVSLELFIDIKSFRSHYGPGVDLASNINGYQEHFLGGKGGRCARITNLPPSCAVVMKSGNLNFVEPSGPRQACNGIALPLPFVVVSVFRVLPNNSYFNGNQFLISFWHNMILGLCEYIMIFLSEVRDQGTSFTFCT